MHLGENAAAAIAGYVGANVAALLTGIELGLQAALFRDAAGQALYFPYGVEVAVPAMLIEHLTIAGIAEAFVTGGVLAWILRANPEMIAETPAAPRPARAAIPTWVWAFLGGLIVLTPLGLLAPGSPWGEWSREELETLGLGYIPAGIDQWSNLWSAPIPDYDIPALNNPTVAYIGSAVAGMAMVALAILALGWLLEKRNGKPAQTSQG